MTQSNQPQFLAFKAFKSTFIDRTISRLNYSNLFGFQAFGFRILEARKIDQFLRVLKLLQSLKKRFPNQYGSCCSNTSFSLKLSACSFLLSLADHLASHLASSQIRQSFQKDIYKSCRKLCTSVQNRFVGTFDLELTNFFWTIKTVVIETEFKVQMIENRLQKEPLSLVIAWLVATGIFFKLTLYFYFKLHICKIIILETR